MTASLDLRLGWNYGRLLRFSPPTVAQQAGGRGEQERDGGGLGDAGHRNRKTVACRKIQRRSRRPQARTCGAQHERRIVEALDRAALASAQCGRGVAEVYGPEIRQRRDRADRRRSAIHSPVSCCADPPLWYVEKESFGQLSSVIDKLKSPNDVSTIAGTVHVPCT